MELSKKEKEAIKFLKVLKDNYKSQAEAIDRSLNKDVYKEEYKVYKYRAEQLEKVLNLISKLQKENENQGKVIDEMYKYYKQLANAYQANSISKGKIRQKIKEYKEMLKTCNKKADIERIKAINERILAYEELLQEK